MGDQPLALAAESFAAELARRFDAIKMGRGTEPSVGLGPLIDAAAVANCRELVRDAVVKGARVLTGGETDAARGYFYPPTVLADVPWDAAIMHEEIFGPVDAIASFSDEDEVLAAANQSPYGLAAYIFTNDLARTVRVAELLQTGMIAVNRGILSNAAAPFGGVKASGFGREGGEHGIDEYLDVKYVALDSPYR